MRITNSMIANNFRKNVQRANEALVKYQEQVATGLLVSKPSDDPTKASQVLSIRNAISKNEQYISNADNAETFLEASSDVYDEVTEILNRTHELAQSGLSDTVDREEVASFVTEIEELLESVVDLGNSEFKGVYLFAGNKIDQAPFVAKYYSIGDKIQDVEYIGDYNQRFQRISKDIEIPLNNPGSEVFSKVFERLIEIRDVIESGTNEEVDDLFQGLEESVNHIANLQTEVGVKIQRLNKIRTRLKNENNSLSDLLTEVEQVDMTEAITNFQMQENVLNATLSSGARLLTPTLFNFL